MLPLVIIVCLVVAISLVIYAFVALPAELAAKKSVQATAKIIGIAAAGTAVGGGLGDKSQQQAFASGATDFVKAMATLGDSMSQLKSGTAALLLAFGLLVFAGTAAGVDDKVPDAKGKTDVAPATPTPTP